MDNETQRCWQREGGKVKSNSNKFLTIAAGVILTDDLDDFAVSLDPHFELFGVHAIITSAVRTEASQMELIRKKAIECNLTFAWPVETMNMEELVEWGDKTVPFWQVVWSQLLSIGQMINPPIPAKAEFEYIHADGRHIPPGHEVGISEHQEKKAIDIARNELHLIEKCLDHAKLSGVNLKYLIEPKNGCVHTVKV
jgi:hypothetical protein